MLFTAFVLLICITTIKTQVPAEPILRIETQQHLGKIPRISVDAAGNYLVTASEDKTARVWELSTGKLLTVLRPPIGEEKEGMLYATAIAPDGGTVAAAGWTGYEWERGKFNLSF